MLFTLNSILKKKQEAVENSVYEMDDDVVRNCPITAGDFFEVVRDGKEDKIYAKLYGEAISQKEDKIHAGLSGDFIDQKDSSGNADKRADAAPNGSNGNAGKKVDAVPTENYAKRLKQIKERLAELKNEEENVTHEHSEEVRRLRQEKKELSAMLAKAEQKDTPVKSLIKFKNCLYATSFSAVVGAVPRASEVHFRQFYERPLFTAGLDRLKEAVENGREIGISGGPCLFGVNEVLVQLTMKDGSVHIFDFSSGRHFQEGNNRDLAEDMETYADDIISVEFTDQKKGVTTQEYDSIRCLFETASALNARLAIPLPDMSYIKFFHNISECLKPDLAEKARARFSEIAVRISGLYREVIADLAPLYPDVEYAVVDSHDEALLQLYYEKRLPFLTESAVRRLTSVRGKTDAVLDYITMPALPYYIWGITDVIQIDCLDETDSYRKCVKLHKGSLNLYAMLYPERISRDGENTIFYAPLEYKDYIERDQYQTGWE